jgi:hypothetical protein
MATRPPLQSLYGVQEIVFIGSSVDHGGGRSKRGGQVAAGGSPLPQRLLRVLPTPWLPPARARAPKKRTALREANLPGWARTVTEVLYQQGLKPETAESR